MKTRLKFLTAMATAALAGTLVISAGAASAASAESAVSNASSENWAGYVANGNNFSNVSGTWTVPTARMDPDANQSYSATWVGLGGSSGQSQSLEQAGTESDYVNGHAQYNAWYELLPAGQVKLGLAVHPGDKISTTVGVNGTTVTVSMTDQTIRPILRTASGRSAGNAGCGSGMAAGKTGCPTFRH
jgi:uncharacterized membrane protein